MRGCVHVGVWVRVCVRPEDEAFPVCGCVVRRVCEWVHLCGCVSVAGKAAQTWTTSVRLVWSAAMTGDTEQHRAGTKVLL